MIVINIIVLVVFIFIISFQRRAIHKIENQLSYFKDAQAKQLELKIKLDNAIDTLPMTVDNVVENHVSNMNIASELYELSEKVAAVDYKSNEFNLQLLKLQVDIYDAYLSEKSYKAAWNYIDAEEAESLNLTYAGMVDMVNWLQPVFKGGYYRSDLHLFKPFFELYIKGKSYYKDNDESFINFMGLYIPSLTHLLERNKEYDEMSREEIWQILAGLGVRYNR